MTPLANVVAEVLRTFDARFYHAAILMALTIPEICISLEQEEPHVKEKHYSDWVKSYMTQGHETIGRDLYKLRCGVSHSGRFTHRDFTHIGYDRIVMTLPESRVKVHGPGGRVVAMQAGVTVMNLDAETLVNDFANGAMKWASAKASDKAIAERMSQIIRVREGSPVPFIANGGPCFA